MTEVEEPMPEPVLQLGVGSLQLYKDKKQRRLPPPQHPRKDFPEPAEPEPTPITVTVPATPEAEPEPANIVAEPRKQGSRRTKPPVEPEPNLPLAAAPRRRRTSLRATQIQLDDESDMFLNGVTGLAKYIGEPNISNAGVIRFALAQLAGRMTYAEVITAMVGDDSAIRPPGRPRG